MVAKADSRERQLSNFVIDLKELDGTSRGVLWKSCSENM